MALGGGPMGRVPLPVGGGGADAPPAGPPPPPPGDAACLPCIMYRVTTSRPRSMASSASSSVSDAFLYGWVKV